MEIGITGYVIILVVIVGVVVFILKSSARTRPCPYCHTMMPMKETKCPKCGKQIPLNY